MMRRRQYKKHITLQLCCESSGDGVHEYDQERPDPRGPLTSKWPDPQLRPGLKPATTLLPDARPSTDPAMRMASAIHSLSFLQIAGSAPVEPLKCSFPAVSRS